MTDEPLCDLCHKPGHGRGYHLPAGAKAPGAKPLNGNLVCPHCQTKGSVSVKTVTRKSGVSGGKATGAVLTGGLSLLATGLSRKAKVKEMHCSNCGMDWAVGA